MHGSTLEGMMDWKDNEITPNLVGSYENENVESLAARISGYCDTLGHILASLRKDYQAEMED